LLKEERQENKRLLAIIQKNLKNFTYWRCERPSEYLLDEWLDDNLKAFYEQAIKKEVE
jgi:hypothetical protein